MAGDGKGNDILDRAEACDSPKVQATSKQSAELGSGESEGVMLES